MPRTKEDLAENAVKGCMILGVVCFILIGGAGYLAGAYVITHFVEKFW